MNPNEAGWDRPERTAAETAEGPRVPRQEIADIDFAVDLVSTRNDIEAEIDALEELSSPDEPAKRIENAELDNTLNEFVELVNACDLDGLADLLAPDAEADFLQETSGPGVIAGISDLIFRYPSLVFTRGDLGSEPIVAAWLFDGDEDRYDLVGYFTFELPETGGGLIQRLEYIEELSDTEGLVLEKPETAEVPEWEDWSARDES